MVINALTSDGSGISQRGKMTTQAFNSPSGYFQVHYYMNDITGKINIFEVKCINNFLNEKPYDTKIGSEYTVLSIMFDFNDQIHVNGFGDNMIYIILDVFGTLMPYPSKLFEITDSTLPNNWILKKLSDDFVRMMPIEWDYSGFWEDYYNGDPVAVNLVKSQLKRL